ncbi:MAG: hypothetical protein NTV45_01660, partial [Firmicutes bacterium]|nr:hypothetical protein [Bacillota bacterium]
RPRIDLEVGCSKGTYIRTLCHDIGIELGSGAYLSALTRIRAGAFSLEKSHSLEEIQQHPDQLVFWVEPVDYPLQHLEQVTIPPETLVKIFNGNQVTIEVTVGAGPIRVYDYLGRLVAIAAGISDGDRTVLQPLKVFPEKKLPR